MNEILLDQQIDDCVDEFEIGLICNVSNQVLVGNPLHKIFYGKSVTSYAKQMKYREHVNAVKLNCLKKFVAFASNSLAIFDLEREISIRQLHDHDGAVTDVAWHHFSPYQLASVSRADGTLRTWDVRSHPAQVSVRRAQRPFSSVEFSPDCNFIACSGETISIFNLSVAQSVVNISCGSFVTGIAFNPAECLLASASEDRLVRFWDVDTGECVTQSLPFESIVHKMEFHPDGKYLLCASSQQLSAIVWEPFELVAQTLKMPVANVQEEEPKFWRTLDLQFFPENDSLLQLSVPSSASKYDTFAVSSNSLLNGTANLSMDANSFALKKSVRLISNSLTDFEQCASKFARSVMGCGNSSESFPKTKEEFAAASSVQLHSSYSQPLPPVSLSPPSSLQPSSIRRPKQLLVSSLKQQPVLSTHSSFINSNFNPSSFSRSTPQTPNSLPDSSIVPTPFIPTHEIQRETPHLLNLFDRQTDDCVDNVDGSGEEGLATNEKDGGSGEGRMSVASSHASSSGGTNADELPSNNRPIISRLNRHSSQSAMPVATSQSARVKVMPQTVKKQTTTGAGEVEKKLIVANGRQQQRRPSSPFCTPTSNENNIRCSPMSSPLKHSQIFAHSQNSANNSNYSNSNQDHLHNTVGTPSGVIASPSKSSLKQLRSRSCTNSKNAPQQDTAHSNLPATNTSAQKSPSKTLNRRLSSTSTKPEKTGTSSEFSTLDHLLCSTQKVQTNAKRRISELDVLLNQSDAIVCNFSEEMVKLAAKQDDLRIFAGLLKMYLEHPKSYSLSLNIKFLEKVRGLFAHSNAEYVVLAVKLLEMIVHAFGDSIRHGLAAKCFALGVDVAAEQRFERCTRCRSALLEIRLNAPFLVDRLDEAHKPTFNNILSQIDRITAD